MERVFITGRGLLTPLGNSVRANEEALRSGKSGIVRVPEFISNHLDSEVGGMVGEVSAADIVDRKKLRFCPPSSVMSVLAVAEALTYRQPLEVTHMLLFENGDCFPVCPKCGITLDREYMSYC